MSHSTQHSKKRWEKLQDKLNDYQTPPEERPPQKKRNRAEERQALVEQRIQEAIERGEFDNLPGKGKPLRLNDNPYLEPGQDLAFGLLKKNGFAPEWIERDKEIRKELDNARRRLRQAWQQRQSNPANAQRWQMAVSQFEASLAKLNQKIRNFNLMVPVVSLQRSPLRLENEVQAVQKDSNTK